MTEQSLIFAALCKAQSEMGKALKDSVNPAFRSKYADLASVMDACLPALNANGIYVYQPTVDDDGGRYVETIFAHVSGETLKCRVPLIVAKNDMQGYGSAVTYARRYGLMSMAGIAPEDDDGNAAAKAPPPPKPSVEDEIKWFTKELPNVKDADGINQLLIRAKQAGREVQALVVARANELGLEYDQQVRGYVKLPQLSPAEAQEGDAINAALDDMMRDKLDH